MGSRTVKTEKGRLQEISRGREMRVWDEPRVQKKTPTFTEIDKRSGRI